VCTRCFLISSQCNESEVTSCTGVLKVQPRRDRTFRKGCCNTVAPFPLDCNESILRLTVSVCCVATFTRATCRTNHPQLAGSQRSVPLELVFARSLWAPNAPGPVRKALGRSAALATARQMLAKAAFTNPCGETPACAGHAPASQACAAFTNPARAHHRRICNHV